jgi:hypothetical protein
MSAGISIGNDHVVKASEIFIKRNKNDKNKYSIKTKVKNDFLTYQTWSNTNQKNINNKRSVILYTPKNWVSSFFPNNNNKFTPTTVMEIGNKKYVFVIENATYNDNKKYNVVFHVSTKEIIKNNNKIKKMTELPVNKIIKNVRFDIDDATSITYNNVTITTTNETGNSNLNIQLTSVNFNGSYINGSYSGSIKYQANCSSYSSPSYNFLLCQSQSQQSPIPINSLVFSSSPYDNYTNPNAIMYFQFNSQDVNQTETVNGYYTG